MLCEMNPSIEARLVRGKSLRAVLPRSKQGDWQPPSDRPHPVEMLLDANRGRVEELLPIKYGRMAVSPFAFFRGAAPLMARDLATLPRTGLLVQLCGDAHVRNLGAFASAEGNIVFDINDFDETMCGPWEWDMKRLATSFVLAGRESGMTDRRCCDAVAALLESYRSGLARFALTSFLELARHHVGRRIEVGPVSAISGKRNAPRHSATSRSSPRVNPAPSSSPTGRRSSGESRATRPKACWRRFRPIARASRASAARPLTPIGRQTWR